MPSWLDNPALLLAIAAAVVALPLLVLVHYGLEYLYLSYGRGYCRRNGFEIVGWRCGPALDASGVKTEFTLIEFDCHDREGSRRIVRLLVWIFGIRRVLMDGPDEAPIAELPPHQEG